MTDEPTLLPVSADQYVHVSAQGWSKIDAFPVPVCGYDAGFDSSLRSPHADTAGKVLSLKRWNWSLDGDFGLRQIAVV